MTALFGDPALRLLARRKFRGGLRRQWRRLRTPSGALFLILGLATFGLWFVALTAGGLVAPQASDPGDLRVPVRLGGLLLVVIAITGSLNHRGLYLPKEEIERLFGAPIKRADLVRYRLLVNTGRAIFAGLIFGAALGVRMPSPLFAFLGVFVAMQTLPVVGQACAILAGTLEKRWAERFTSWPARVVMVGSVLIGCALFVVLVVGRGVREVVALEWLADLVPGDLPSLWENPIVVAVTLPLAPWANAITASSWSEFGPWFLLCVFLWAFFFEGTARLPVDFRELSLETSASVAERLRRHRRVGGGASAGKVWKAAAGLRVPWLFGRGPAGALAWRKGVAIVRKARGTLWVSSLVLVFLTLFATNMGAEMEETGSLGGAVFLAVLGCIYLCAGLRFDFRDDLDRMEIIKSWPVAPTKLFIAMLLPEVVLVSVLLTTGVLAQGLLLGDLQPATGGVVAMVPAFVLLWVALDNAVFLFAPVRFVPGQDGALHNAGRAAVMMVLRGLLLGVVGGLIVLSVMALAWLLGRVLEWEEELALTLALAVAWLELVLAAFGLCWIGGRMLRRFDVARDRG